MRWDDRRFQRLVTLLILLALLSVTLYNIRLCRQIDAATRAMQEQTFRGGPVVPLPQETESWYTYSPEAGALVPKYIDWEED